MANSRSRCHTRLVAGPAPAFRRCALVASLLLLAACSNVEKAGPRPQTGDRVNKDPLPMEVDPIMRGTIASETVMVGFDDTVVRGYGLVVGLKGTGSRIMPADVRAFLLQEMAKMGVGDPGLEFSVSPETLLNSNDVAAVVVEGVIPPGANKDSTFDVRVASVPGSGATSLEGGRLWTAPMRPGPLTSGNKQAAALAEARGPLFVNPFVDPNPGRSDTISRLSGRILDGGRVLKNMPLKLRLATPSHNRAMTLQTTINSVFPREPGQDDKTAHGKSDETISINIPPSYYGRTSDFVQLLRHTSINFEAVEQTATAVRRTLLANPGAAASASWRWQSMGAKAVPSFQDLYTYSEEQPRFAALQAGAKLNDAMVVPPLLDMARTGSHENRVGAIELLGAMGHNPAIDVGLRPLLDDPDVDIRLKTFEALEKRKDVVVLGKRIDDRFVVNLVPSKFPMVYVSQSGQPRLVIFGDDLSISRPATLAAWDNRFMLRADSGDEKVEVFYRPLDGGRPVVDRVTPSLPEFVLFLGHKPSPESPEPGLGLSYSETIGAVHEIWKARYLGRTDFKAEQDRVLAAITRMEKEKKDTERPEFDDVATEEAAGPLLASPRESDLNQLTPPAAALDRGAKPADTVPR
ncbi:MAG: flagellar basal body P-ring protein FlgI [Phycisphaerales bacterium]